MVTARHIRSRDRSDAGTTLVEVLVAVAILGIAAVAILTGLQVSVKASDIHRKQATGGAYVRAYAEAIERHLDTNANYRKCAAAGDYGLGDIGFTPPSGYVAEHTAATPLDGNGVATGTSPCADTGVQRVTLIVRSADDRAVERLTVVLRRSCGAGTSCD